jgi:serine/threonine protein kinase
MHAVLTTAASPDAAARALCEAAIAAGSTDNASAIVLRVDALPPPDPQDAAATAIALPVPSRMKPGAEIDGFHVVKLLHESRATLLYQVRDDASGHLFVLKTLHPSLADDAEERARFAHEEWLARRLNARYFAQHVPIPAIRKNYLYFTTTWHAGTTLQQQLDADRHFTIPDIVQLGTKLARGLGALHRRSIVHRDIKPANLHVGDDGELRVLDLGIALSGQDGERDATGPAGTPSFLAPEQFGGDAASAQTDLYAAGVTLYHLLIRRYPYGEIEPFQHPRFGEPVPPSRFRPDLPPWLENVLLKAVARDPAERFETAEEMLLALERGAARPIAAPRPIPLARRDPVRFWQGVAALALVANLLLLYLLVAR